jgi:hypothetical protein
MYERKISLLGFLFLSVLIMLTTASTGPAQEIQAEPLPQATPAAPESPKPQELLNTAGKTRLSLHGLLGFGFDHVDVGTTTSGDTVSISGGGGFGGGAGIAFGLSRSLDLDLDLGFQVGGLTPAVDNANGSFTRGYFLATLKYKKPTSDTGQLKFGAGLGAYYGGKLKFERTDMYFKDEVDYDPAVGLHFTGEFERFIRPNVSFNIGAKIYFVEYKAKSSKFNSVEVPVSALKDDVRNLNGSGMDFMIGINTYFN